MVVKKIKEGEEEIDAVSPTHLAKYQWEQTRKKNVDADLIGPNRNSYRKRRICRY